MHAANNLVGLGYTASTGSVQETLETSTLGWPAALLPEIAHAIESHSFSAGLVPRTLEAKVVQDADRLDAIGATGLTGAARGRRFPAPGRGSPSLHPGSRSGKNRRENCG